jgi:hypothetical protein
MNNRENALKWWRGLTIQEQKDVVKKYYPSVQFELFTLSSSKIERLYFLLVLNEKI